MEKRNAFLLFGICAVILTSIGYLLDTDPSYSDFKMTVIEFSIITIFFFLGLSTLYFIKKMVHRIIKIW